MSNWDELREVRHQVPPPAFDSLVSTAAKRDRRAWIATGAAALAFTLVAAVGFGFGMNDGNDGLQPVGDPSETTTEDGLPLGVLALPPRDEGKRYVILDAGRYRIELNDTLSFDVDLPQDTYAHSDGAFITSGEVILRVTDQGYTVPVDPCHDQSRELVGPTVEDLVEAISSRKVYRVNPPEPVEFDGATGQYLELRIPARFDATPCQGGELGLPANAADGAETGTPGFVARFWILDVAGTRVVVAPFCVACEAGSAQSMHQRVQSITFNQAVGTTP